jgi:hypothetical protein
MFNKKIVIAIGVFSAYTYAADWQNQYGPTSQYSVTLYKMEFCTDSSCSTAHTIAENTKTFDIASKTIGAELGSYANKIILPPKGVIYTHLRSTVNRTFTITGYAPSADGSSAYCYTNGTGGSYTTMSPGTLAASTTIALANATPTSLVSVNDTSVSGGTITANKNGSGTASITFTYSSSEISGDNILYTIAMDAPYTYSGKTPLIDVSFGTQTALTSMEAGGGNNSNDCNLFPGDPNMRVTIK